MIITKTFAVGHRYIELRVYVPMVKVSELPAQTNEAAVVLMVAAGKVVHDSAITLSSNRAGLHYATFIPNSVDSEARLSKAGWNKCKRN